MNKITGAPTFIREQNDVVSSIIFANFEQVLLLAILGYVMKKYVYSVPSLIIGILLGTMVEGEI